MKTIQDEFPLGAKVRLTKEYCEGIVVGYEDDCVLVALPLEGSCGWIPELDDNRLGGIDIHFSSNSFINKYRFYWAAFCNLQRVDEPCMNPQRTENYYDSHYHNCVLEPIKVMEKLFTPEEFKGFLKGCILKYRLRLGNKVGEDFNKELTKIQRYEQWLKETEEGKEITV